MASKEGLVREFTEKYMEKIFYFCLKKTGNEYEAEDLTSDISLNIIHALDNGTVPRCFPAWVWQIARNRYSAWAAWKAKVCASVTGADVEEYEIEDEKGAVEDKVIHTESLSLLRRELAFIASEYRNILIAYYMEEQTTRRIASYLNISQGTVEARLFRARKILKEGMNMAREFGPKSYNPEKVSFVSDGPQGGYPWSYVQRSLPRNILLEAEGNPSTVEELSMALGIARPYMEEEIALLEEATLLKKEGGKYVTNFLIIDKEAQLEIYQEQRRASRERSAMLDTLVSESLEQVRTLVEAHREISDNTLKWWLVLHTINSVLIPNIKGISLGWPKRENGDEWGFVGYEEAELPENVKMGHEGLLLEDGSGAFWMYQIPRYSLRDRKGMKYNELMFLNQVLRNNRNTASFTAYEEAVWERLNGKFAHAEEDGSVRADIVLVPKNRQREIRMAIQSHPLYEKLAASFQEVYDKTVDIISRNSNSILKNQIATYAGVEIYDLRSISVYDEVESGGLVVPENPGESTVAMYLVLDM